MTFAGNLREAEGTRALKRITGLVDEILKGWWGVGAGGITDTVNVQLQNVERNTGQDELSKEIMSCGNRG